MTDASEFKQYYLPDPEEPAVDAEREANIVSGGGFYQSSNYVPGVSGWFLGATFSEFNVSVSIASLNIPDTTTVSSFHTDVSGNSWWGANVASGYANANAAILADGSAIFKSLQIGGATVQYTVSNNGVFSFGDGNDGAATFDGSATPTGSTKSGSDYTLTRDVYYTDMTVSTGCTVNPAGYRIFGTGTLTLNGTAKIMRNGNAGSSGTGGIALADGYLKGSVAGGDGAGGGTGQTFSSGVAAGSNASATNTTNSLGSNGTNGGTGGSGGSGAFSGAAGGTSTGGTATPANVRIIDPFSVRWMLDISSTGSTIKYDNSAGSGGGAGGGGGGSANMDAINDGSHGGSGGTGGGAGSAGGILLICFRIIIIGASAKIQANGGNGAAGSAGSNGFHGATWTNHGGGGGGGGGAGGNGGQVVLAYNTLTNSGTVEANGGTGGAGGSGGTGDTGGQNGAAGSSGASGSQGDLRQFQLSL